MICARQHVRREPHLEVLDAREVVVFAEELDEADQDRGEPVLAHVGLEAGDDVLLRPHRGDAVADLLEPPVVEGRDDRVVERRGDRRAWVLARARGLVGDVVLVAVAPEERLADAVVGGDVEIARGDAERVGERAPAVLRRDRAVVVPGDEADEIAPGEGREGDEHLAELALQRANLLRHAERGRRRPDDADPIVEPRQAVRRRHRGEIEDVPREEQRRPVHERFFGHADERRLLLVGEQKGFDRGLHVQVAHGVDHESEGTIARRGRTSQQ